MKKPRKISNRKILKALRNPSKVQRFSSLEWTSIGRVEMISYVIAIFGSGPYIYWCHDKDQASNGEPIKFEAQLCVFEATGTQVRGCAQISKSVILAWGDSYIAHIHAEQLFKGGTLCARDILSTGQQIAYIMKRSNSIEVYYANGMIQRMEYAQKKKSGRPTLLPISLMCMP